MTALQRFFGIERSVDAAIDNPGAALPRHAAHFIAAQGVPGVNADAHKVSRLDARRHQGFKGFVDDDRIAKGEGGGPCQYIQPTGGDHRRAKRVVAGVYEENGHWGSLLE